MTPAALLALAGQGITELNGLRIVEDGRLMVGPIEDWSQVRSPGRARRRRAKHPQRIRHVLRPDPKVYRMGGTLVMHPVTAASLRQHLISQEPTHGPE